MVVPYLAMTFSIGVSGRVNTSVWIAWFIGYAHVAGNEGISMITSSALFTPTTDIARGTIADGIAIGTETTSSTESLISKNHELLHIYAILFIFQFFYF